MKSAYNAVRKAIFSRKEEPTFAVDSQWILESDFGMAQVKCKAVPDTANTETTSGERKSSKDRGKARLFKITKKCPDNDSKTICSTERFNVITWQAKDNPKSNEMTLASDKREGEEMQERIPNIFNVMAGLKQERKCDDITQKESEELHHKNETNENSIDSSTCSDDYESDSSDSDSDSSLTSSEYSTSSDEDSDSFTNNDEFIPNLETISENEMENELNQQENHDNEEVIEKPKQDDKCETTYSGEEDSSEDDEEETNTSVSQIRSIRQMWHEREKDTEHAPKPLLPSRIYTANPKCLVSASTSKQDATWIATERKNDVACKRDSPDIVSSKQTDEDECDKESESLQIGKTVVDNKVCNSNYAEEKPIQSSVGIVQRLALQMQDLENKVRKEEDMIANHQPLRTGSTESRARKQAEAKPDDSFLLYLLEVGRKDEQNNSKKSKKSVSFFRKSNTTNDSFQDKQTGQHKITRAFPRELDIENNVNFVDETITDPYFREILLKKSIPNGVKAKLKEECWSIFNNPGTPRSVKKSILDNMVLKFTQSSS